MTTLTKADIVQAVSHKTNHTVGQSADLVETLFEMIKQTLESGEEVLISGFGKWSVRAKRERREGKKPPNRRAPDARSPEGGHFQGFFGLEEQAEWHEFEVKVARERPSPPQINAPLTDARGQWGDGTT